MSFDAPAKGFGSRLESSFETLAQRLEQAVARGATLPPAAMERLRGNWNGTALVGLLKYLDLLMVWGKRHDLHAARSADELVDLSVPDAWMLACFADEGSSWADIGTGAGAPGLPLKLMRPDLQMTLVEPRTKRVAFLRTVVGQVNAGAIPVLRKRSDELGTKVFDAVVSRAVLAPQPWLEHGSTLARRDVWILVAQADAPALDGYTCDVDVTYEWPLTRVSRRILRYRAA
jgi:16S rRNA (guanine527-N7)-methyltransferase